MLIQCMPLNQGCLNVVCMLSNFLSIVKILKIYFLVGNIKIIW